MPMALRIAFVAPIAYILLENSSEGLTAKSTETAPQAVLSQIRPISSHAKSQL
jgi:hypothetical protein